MNLDYTIERDTDRMKAVYALLQENERPSPRQLEQMANYIMYGKDEKNLSVVDRKQVQIDDTRYGSFRKIGTKVQSLDAMLENPATTETSLAPLDGSRYIYKKEKPKIAKPTYHKDGSVDDPGDGSIPGMRELWDDIAHLQYTLDVWQGKIRDPAIAPATTYQIFKLRHMLIDVRKHQYYLKDSYRPAIHFVAIPQPTRQLVHWEVDAGYFVLRNQYAEKLASAPPWTKTLPPKARRRIDDSLSPREDEDPQQEFFTVQRQTFDYENALHIRYLLDFYGDIYKQLWDVPDSYGRALIFDIDKYVELANFSPVRYYMLERKVDHWPHARIQEELRDRFGIEYDVNHIATILNDEIPKKIAMVAKQKRIEIEAKQNGQQKICKSCGRLLPIHGLYFAKNASHKDGFSSNCKECERQKRIEKGLQSPQDRRKKEGAIDNEV